MCIVAKLNVDEGDGFQLSHLELGLAQVLPFLLSSSGIPDTYADTVAQPGNLNSHQACCWRGEDPLRFTARGVLLYPTSTLTVHPGASSLPPQDPAFVYQKG